MDKKLIKSILLIIAYCLLLVAVIINISGIFDAVKWFFALLSPVFIGFGIAFVLYRPFMFFKKLYSKPRKKKKTATLPVKISEKKIKRKETLIKTFSLFTVYLFFFAFITMILWLIIPEITNSLSQLYLNLESYQENFTDLLNELGNWLPFEFKIAEPILADNAEEIVTVTERTVTLVEYLSDQIAELTQNLPNILSDVLPDLFNITKSVASSVVNWGLGLIMSIYMLAGKETITRQFKRFFYAFIPKKAADRACEILHISSDIFSGFVNGRLFDALIVGMICFICMSMFNFQYTLLISVVIAVTNIIPIFGPFIGAVPSIFLLLLVDPMQAVWFTVFIIILQQIDGNLIGPKVVGDSIGLPAWWVMFAITIGGGLMGVFGMLAGVPTFAVVYNIVSESITKRLGKKEISGEKL